MNETRVPTLALTRNHPLLRAPVNDRGDGRFFFFSPARNYPFHSRGRNGPSERSFKTVRFWNFSFGFLRGEERRVVRSKGARGDGAGVDLLNIRDEFNK